MMGVSSAWNYGTDHDQKTAVKGDASQLNARKIQGSISRAVSDNKAAQAAGSQVRLPESQESSFYVFDEKKMEIMFDSWQSQTKHFFADLQPKVVAFLSMASKKSGFVKGKVVPDLQMAGNTPSTIKLHLQPVSNAHGAWLMRDGRLKTVASH